MPAPGRWPGREPEDWLVVPLGFAALALARSEAAAFESIRNRVQASAASVASTDPLEVDWPAWSFAVAGLQVIDAEGPGGPRIEVQLVRSAVGPVPTLGRAAPAASALAIAAAATLAVCAHPVSAAGRLATALALEGLVGWYRQADPHLQPPQQAVAYSLRHAAARMNEVGRSSPPELVAAVKEHRTLTPMAGGG